MSKDNSELITFNLPSSIRSTTRIPILFPEAYEVWVLLFEDYIIGIKTHGLYIWKFITSSPW